MVKQTTRKLSWQMANETYRQQQKDDKQQEKKLTGSK